MSIQKKESPEERCEQPCGEERLFPSHLQIEVVAGVCSADCIMCTIRETPRKGILSLEDFSRILDKFQDHVQQLEFLTLHGMGEPLLDPTLPEKVALARDRGFKGIGFATNATHLTRERAEKLLASGLNTLIISLDGIRKATHESIRRGVDYDRIFAQVLDFIELRNRTGHTKIIIRMIRQDANRGEWEEYRKFWTERLRPDFGDQVSAFDVHNWGVNGQDSPEAIERLKQLEALSREKKIVCPDLLERMFIFIDGKVALCCGDEKGRFELGNIFRDEPEEIYNNAIFSGYRKKMREGRLTEIAYCKNCQILLSRMKKQYLDV